MQRRFIFGYTVSIRYNNTDKLFIVILYLMDYMGTTYWQFKIVNAYRAYKKNQTKQISLCRQ